MRYQSILLSLHKVQDLNEITLLSSHMIPTHWFESTPMKALGCARHRCVHYDRTRAL